MSSLLVLLLWSGTIGNTGIAVTFGRITICPGAEHITIQNFDATAPMPWITIQASGAVIIDGAEQPNCAAHKKPDNG